MRPQTLLLFVVAVGCGLGAMYLVRQNSANKAQSDMVDVLVAGVAIEGGATINTETMIGVKKVPKDFVPEKVFTDKAALKDRASRFPILKDEIISEGKLAPPGMEGMETLIEEGKRAVTLAVSTDSAVAG